MGRHQRPRLGVTAWTWLVLVLLAIALLILWRVYDHDLLGSYTAPPVPGNWGAPDDLQWDDEATALRHTALADVRGVAEKWGATVAALLGVFGIVVFAKGPSTLTDVPGKDAYAVLVLAVLAVAAAAAATYLGALAAQGTPENLDNLNGWTLKQLYKDRLPIAIGRLKKSRALTLAAALLILSAVVIAWLAALHGRGKTEGQSVLVTSVQGRVMCGKLKLIDGKLVLEFGKGANQPLEGVRQVVTVAACPK
jgi:hypothetical protein